MNHTLACLLAAALTAVAAPAQACFQAGNGASVASALQPTSGGLDPVSDEGLTTPLPLGFPFPMAGAATALTHASIDSNGMLYLSAATGPTGLAGQYVYGSLAALRGAAGGSPRIAPFWRDLQAMPVGWDITTEATPGVSFAVVWRNTTDFAAVGPARSFRATLFATGVVEFAYDVFPILSAFVGISAGNGAGSPTAAASNFAASASGGTAPLLYEDFATPASWDLSGKTIRFTPNLLGGFAHAVVCAPQQASHEPYGAGCYTVSDSWYALFANAVGANAALQGQSLVFRPIAGSYRITAGGGVFVAPGAGASPVFATPADDAETIVALATPLATPQGPQAAIRVHSNGVISWGPTAQSFPGGNNYAPAAAPFRNAANAGVWFWHDFNESEAGSGRIVREQVGGVLYVTWNDVENYANPEGQNRSTIQAQLELATGRITLVFQSVDANPTSLYGSATLVGWSPGGASVDGGSQALAASLPYDVPAANALPVALTASPAPVSTATAGTLVTYTHAGVPENAPGAGVRLGLTLVSVGQDLPGTDLSFLGAPGCRLHVASLDATYAFLGVGSTQTTTFVIPPGVPAGFDLFAQGASLVAPNSLPNGQNSFGVVLSNALRSRIQPQ
jgi:hypothetical protein